ncbi:unnamed protein product [Cuscuta campestris]|uniref:Uncharacterized protein n=1 Tax=Cuscuta campestris TaxID=132261 RepID=A0A484LNP5_9ASTE|nr:unnamed protein product [Cuscuta campestris]
MSLLWSPSPAQPKLWTTHRRGEGSLEPRKRKKVLVPTLSDWMQFWPCARQNSRAENLPSTALLVGKVMIV